MSQPSVDKLKLQVKEQVEQQLKDAKVNSETDIEYANDVPIVNNEPDFFGQISINTIILLMTW